ncbi:DUF4258 domain-containing protein [Parablautia muri]|uniref:DUF4258 domain-containing protein n=1 Tax=Parablautia muri TaxID=2320879 RepID=A0A9X5BG65_9FIRM|nr:DUF4258 domain-containing protein [Parablautia muri]NBJ93088.1 DUF4258 domain-containing protein [Parablautia muri]
MITIEQLKALNKPENIAVTEHARIRLYERHLNIDDIVNGINSGEIIKQYSDDRPLPSCLILGFSVKSKYIHIVASCDTDFIYLITAYFPNPTMWENDLRTRKRC